MRHRSVGRLGAALKRFVLGLMMIVLVAGPVATANAEGANAKIERRLVGRYGAYPSPVTGCNSALGPWACMVVPTHRTERFVSVKVTDRHGQPVYFHVLGDGIDEGFCGATNTPVPFHHGRNLEIEVGVYRWPIDQTLCTASRVKTTGTIEVTLSNLP